MNYNDIFPSFSLPYLPGAGVGGGVGAGVGGGVGGGVVVVGFGQSSSTLFPVRAILLPSSYWEPSERRTVSPQLKLTKYVELLY